MVCTGTGCAANGALEVKEALENEIAEHGFDEKVKVVATGCHGFCAHGPIVTTQPDGIFYQHLEPKKVPRLVQEHIVKGRPVEEYMYTPTESDIPIPRMSDIEFFKRQKLLVLRNRGLIDPEEIDDYIERDGYMGLAKALTRMTPEEVIEEVISSGLRGRGGAGFPTGKKWQFTRLEKNKPKYVICNANQADPLVASDPHSVIEGMAICAFAVGSSSGYIYVRKEYPLVVKRLNIAIEQAREHGFLGDGIYGTDFSFDITIALASGDFICGEATALVSAIEGHTGEPRSTPPRLVQSGLHGKPTNLNNVETFANVPQIIRHGASWFNSIGTEKSKGTKILSLTGDVVNTGLVEVPMGITLREIIYDIGGGIPGGKRFKAVQIGGPSGGCIPAELLDLPIDFESLVEAGSIMGNGGILVMDEDTCMVDVSKFSLDFLAAESCGKCTPCRDGTKLMLNTLTKICEGKGTPEDLEELENVAKAVKDTSLCGLGQTAPNPVLTTMKYFRDEYEAHIHDKTCPAKVCRAMLTFSIDAERCAEFGHGCGMCRRNCPSEAIVGSKGKAHRILPDKCIQCGVCRDVCNFEAVLVE